MYQVYRAKYFMKRGRIASMISGVPSDELGLRPIVSNKFSSQRWSPLELFQQLETPTLVISCSLDSLNYIVADEIP